ncbi:hypothetical protein DET54_102646 [Paenibacillus pabuli]|uniref:Uncharacterized protein n=1 Tax=Paenibacillus pabuli TaxID=1472 RepID=A0ABX9BQU4_9BACL|nr:hypothetical protein DET54_102646 [Paenibacillus pabuli]
MGCTQLVPQAWTVRVLDYVRLDIGFDVVNLQCTHPFHSFVIKISPNKKSTDSCLKAEISALLLYIHMLQS